MSEFLNHQVEIQGNGPSAEITRELSVEIHTRLLASAIWAEPLTKYASATHLAVALVNPDGELIGSVFNAQPLWALLAKCADPSGRCPFSISTGSSCTCTGDTLSSGKPIIVRDDCGLVHFSVPLILNGYRLGAVIAGQVFDKYPENLPLEKLAKRLNLGGQVWELARRAPPIRMPTLRVYADMLAIFADAVLQGAYSVIQAEQLVESEGQVKRTKVALESTKEELRALAARLMTMQDDERRRVAREIHDDMNQRLAVLSNKLISVIKELPAGYTDVHRQLMEIEVDASSISDDMRRVAYRLYPATLDDLGLPLALKRLTQEFKNANAVPVSFTVRHFPEAISEEISICLYRITQEALQNVMRHAGGASATVILSGKRSGVRLAVCDKGRGFDVNARENGGLGMISMRERVRLAGGTLKIRSRRGRGASILVWVPCFTF